MPDSDEGRAPGLSLFDGLKKIAEPVAITSLSCYAMGFAITNLYLGKLGVVSLEILRPKYVLTGLAFSVFVSVIVVPLRALYRLIFSIPRGQVKSILGQTFLHSVSATAAIAGVVLILSQFMSAPGAPLLGLPGNPTPLALSVWLSRSLPETLARALSTSAMLALAVVLFAALALAISAILVLFPTKGLGLQQSGRKQRLLEMLGELRNARIWAWVGRLLALLCLLVASQVILSIVSFMSPNAISGSSPASATQPLSSPSGSGLDHFLLITIALYTAGAITLLALRLVAESSTPWASAGARDPGARFRFLSAAIFWIGVGLASLVPVYVAGIHPLLPQQLGGGQVMPVHVIVGNEKLSAELGPSNNDLYLVDRTSQGILLLVVDKAAQKRRVLEISGSEVKGLVHLALPEDFTR